MTVKLLIHGMVVIFMWKPREKIPFQHIVMIKLPQIFSAGILYRAIVMRPDYIFKWFAVAERHLSVSTNNWLTFLRTKKNLIVE